MSSVVRAKTTIEANKHKAHQANGSRPAAAAARRRWSARQSPPDRCRRASWRFPAHRGSPGTHPPEPPCQPLGVMPTPSEAKPKHLHGANLRYQDQSTNRLLCVRGRRVMRVHGYGTTVLLGALQPDTIPMKTEGAVNMLAQHFRHAPAPCRAQPRAPG